MTYNTTVIDTLDDHMLDDASITGGHGADTVSERPGPQPAPSKLKAANQARTAADSDGIRAFMTGFTASAARPDASDSYLNIPPATKEFLKAASFLVRK